MNETQKFKTPEGHRQRLKERFMSSGIYALADYEVVELLLMLSIPRIDVKPLAKLLMDRYSSLKAILNINASELRSIKGIGDNTIHTIRFIREVVDVYNVQELQTFDITLDTVVKLKKFFKSRLDSESKEVIDMACFDSQLRLMKGGIVRIAEGNVNSASVDIRKIIEVAIKNGATSIVLSHNHPHGDCKPSFDDIRFTKKISLACQAIGLSLIEHIIVAKSGCFSFRNDGELDVLYDVTVNESRIKKNTRVATDIKRLR